MIIDLLFQNPVVGVLLFSFIVIAISVHEAAHAFMANYLGDNTPKSQGRLTLNPLSHLDPWGTLLIVIAGIGWGRPVVFNPFNLKNPRRDTALIALAGPVSNILMAILAVSILNFFGPASFLSAILIPFITLNIALAVFNMIPIDPLDGFKVVAGILPPHLAYQWEDTRKYGLLLLIFILLSGTVERIVFPAVQAIQSLLFRLFII